MKALIVVLFIASITFRLAKPIGLQFIAAPDFIRRRNVWIALTIVAFLSPNFWLFALIAAPTYVWIGRKDSNPIAAYLLLMHVVPPVPVQIPTIGTMQLFDLDNYRLLSCCVLIPAALRARRAIDKNKPSASKATDFFMLAYGLVQIALFVPPDLANHVILHDSVTHLLRRTFLFCIDVFVLYYAISRSCSDQRKIVDAQASFCLSAAIMALVAAFETTRQWLLYTEFAHDWNPMDTNVMMAWLFRGDSLRAQAAAGNALSLGCLLAVAFGLWLYLQTRVPSLRRRIAVGAVYWLGMIATFSRGPWIGAALIFVLYSLLKPRVISRLLKSTFVAAIALGVIAITPLGEKAMNSLPFHHVESDANVLYRQRLVERSVTLIAQSPLFGDQLAIQKMEDLRQGQGIIDIVNSYVGVALFNGLVGLTLFVGLILSASLGAYRSAKEFRLSDPDRSLLAYGIVACVLGMAFLIADSSLILAVEKAFYVVIALAAAIARQDPPVSSNTQKSLSPDQNPGRNAFA